MLMFKSETNRPLFMENIMTDKNGREAHNWSFFF